MTAIASPSNTIQTSGPARRGKQKIVVVLGMHRSGTSLLTNLLSVLGVDLGKDLLAGDSANELGYWENESIYRTQDALLNHIAQDWGELGAVYPFAIDWSRLPEFQSYKQELISIVRAESRAPKESGDLKIRALAGCFRFGRRSSPNLISIHFMCWPSGIRSS